MVAFLIPRSDFRDQPRRLKVEPRRRDRINDALPLLPTPSSLRRPRRACKQRPRIRVRILSRRTRIVRRHSPVRTGPRGYDGD
jgi:hypothetical protein